MKRTTIILVFGIACSLNAVSKAQTGVQTDTQTSGQASVQHDQSHAQISSGASSSVSAQPGSMNAGLSSATTFNAVLNAPVDSKKAKAGDSITAHTVENVKADGKTVLPRGTKLMGHVTQASARAKGDAESTLGIAFDRAILKNGQEVPLRVGIQALAAAQTAASTSEADTETMASAGAGAAGSGMARGSGTLGGVTSATGGSVGAVTNTAARVGGTGDAALNSTVGSTASAAAGSRGAIGGLNAAGQLRSNSRGVFNLSGVSLNSSATNEAQASVITSAGKNVHLDSGTRILMVTQTAVSATPNR